VKYPPPELHRVAADATVDSITRKEPAARLVPMKTSAEGAPRNRIGVAKGSFQVPANIDRHNDEIARLFLGEHS